MVWRPIAHRVTSLREQFWPVLKFTTIYNNLQQFWNTCPFSKNTFLYQKLFGTFFDSIHGGAILTVWRHATVRISRVSHSTARGRIYNNLQQFYKNGSVEGGSGGRSQKISSISCSACSQHTRYQFWCQSDTWGRCTRRLKSLR